MKLPYLKFWDNTPVVVTLTNGVDRNGVPIVVKTVDTKCCFSEKQKIIRASNGQMVNLTGSLTIGYDIAPELTKLNGYVQINGNADKYNITIANRPRNPDGTVNHTYLGLI